MAVADRRRGVDEYYEIVVQKNINPPLYILFYFILFLYPIKNIIQLLYYHKLINILGALIRMDGLFAGLFPSFTFLLKKIIN